MPDENKTRSIFPRPEDLPTPDSTPPIAAAWEKVKESAQHESDMWNRYNDALKTYGLDYEKYDPEVAEWRTQKALMDKKGNK